MLECMKTKPAFALNAKELEIGFISQPVVDVDYASDPFLPIDPIDALESGLFATDVDVLLGSNQNEGFLLTEVILIQYQCRNKDSSKIYVVGSGTDLSQVGNLYQLTKKLHFAM